MIHHKDIPRVVFSLSLLIQTNNKRISYYRAAAERVANSDTKSLLLAYAEQSESYSSDLTRWVKAYGATPAPQKKSIATMAWDKLKEVLVSATETLPVTSGAIEDDTLKIYKTALALYFLPGGAINDIRKHIREFEKARDTFRQMSNSELASIGSLATA